MSNKTVNCPHCKEEINPLSEEYFTDEFLSDAGSSGIECKKCGALFYINTILNPTFEIDEDWES